jgi:hypothetical protein
MTKQPGAPHNPFEAYTQQLGDDPFGAEFLVEEFGIAVSSNRLAPGSVPLGEVFDMCDYFDYFRLSDRQSTLLARGEVQQYLEQRDGHSGGIDSPMVDYDLDGLAPTLPTVARRNNGFKIREEVTRPDGDAARAKGNASRRPRLADKPSDPRHPVEDAVMIFESRATKLLAEADQGIFRSVEIDPETGEQWSVTSYVGVQKAPELKAALEADIAQARAALPTEVLRRQRFAQGVRTRPTASETAAAEAILRARKLQGRHASKLALHQEVVGGEATIPVESFSPQRLRTFDLNDTL